MPELHDLHPPQGSRRARKRVGRGPGSGKGKTSGRGHKGQGSRSGGSVPAGFEGGQMPLQRRIPKRGFKNFNRVEYQVVNVRDLARFAAGPVTPERLREGGLIRDPSRPVKVLGTGEIEGAYEVSAHAFSAAARAKIEGAGGSVTVLESHSRAEPLETEEAPSPSEGTAEAPEAEDDKA